MGILTVAPSQIAGDLMRKSHGFTLIELMVTMVVIGILATLVLAALSRAQQSANQSKTKATVLKLNEIIANRWDTYRYRRIPVGTQMQIFDQATQKTITYRLDAFQAAVYRTKVIRKLQRMELPDRWGDITPIDDDGDANTPGISSRPITGLKWRDINKSPDAAGAYRTDLPISVSTPALYYAYQTYFNTVSNTAEQPNRVPTAVYEGAECLYMIVKVGGVDENDSLTTFGEKEVGDVDDDGAPEFLDAWGMPIEFIRWPVGFVDSPKQDDPSDVQYQSKWVFGHLSDIQPPKQPKTLPNGSLLEKCRCNTRDHHDPFDPRQTDRFAFEVFPLIYSAGADKKYDIYHGITNRDTLIACGPPVDPTYDPYANPLDNMDDPFVEIRTDAVPCSAYDPISEFEQNSHTVWRPKAPGTPKSLLNEPRLDNGSWIWEADIVDGELSHFDNIHNHTLDNRLR